MKIFIKVVDNKPVAKLAEELLSEFADKFAIGYFIKFALPGEYIILENSIVFRHK